MRFNSGFKGLNTVLWLL